jgi:hypothetical protein
MRSPALGCLVVASLVHPAAIAAQSGDRSVVIVASATIAPRTSLRVSAQVLEFRIDPGATEGLATIDFTAAARALPESDVVMHVKADGGLTGPGGAADVDAEVAFTGDGAGALSGTLQLSEATAAARWIGGGVRTGRVVFKLRASTPGDYRLPVRFAISVP